MTERVLQEQLLAAHAKGDRAALPALYKRAADGADEESARAFFLTHAMIYALEAGLPEAALYRAELVAMGREEA